MGSFRGADGTLFYTSLVKPADFDPARKYPAVVYVYGGPHAQVVKNEWSRGTLLDRLLASKGILVWSMDNRGSWGRGHAFETPILKKLGTVELADQLAGIAELKKLPFVDGGRLGHPRLVVRRLHGALWPRRARARRSGASSRGRPSPRGGSTTRSTPSGT